MNHKNFQLSKVRRFINTHGRVFQFDRPGKDEFGEPNGKTVSHKVRGVFHQTFQSSTGYITQTSGESTTTRLKPNPQLLTLWEEAKILKLQDEVSWGSKHYRVNEVVDLLQAGIIADISLEEVQGP